MKSSKKLNFNIDKESKKYYPVGKTVPSNNYKSQVIIPKRQTINSKVSIDYYDNKIVRTR